MLREQIELLREAMRRRGVLDAVGPCIDRGEQLERERRALIQAVDERKARRNLNAQEVARRKRAGEPADDLIVQGRALGDESCSSSCTRFRTSPFPRSRKVERIKASSGASGARHAHRTVCGRIGRLVPRSALSTWIGR